MSSILLALLLSQSGVQIWNNGSRVSPDTAKLNLNGSVNCTRPRQGEASCAFTSSDAGVSGGSFDAGVYGAADGTEYAVNVAAPGTLLSSKTLTVAAGDVVKHEVIVSINNNSGAAASYTLACVIDSTTVASIATSTTIAASATTRSPFTLWCDWAVVSPSSTLMTARMWQAPPTAAGAGNTGVMRETWQTSASNWTGTHTFKVYLSSSSTTATQTGYVHHYRVEHLNRP